MTVCNVDGCDRPKRATNGMCGMHYQRWRKKGTTDLRTAYATCTVEGCDRKADRNVIGLCEAHYMQKRRNGNVTSVEVRPRHGGPGNFAHAVECKETGCATPAISRDWCSMHYTRWLRHGNPQITVEPTLPSGTDHHAWRGDSVGYTAVHDRIRRRCGSASRHACSHCGGAAQHWAYDHGDPAEMVDDMYGPYSTDLARYLPLCVPCHKRFDLDYLNEKRSA